MDVTVEQTTTLRAESHHPPIVLEGNGSRPSHKGNGYKESEEMFTLNSTEVHAVIVEHHPNDSRTKIADDQKNCQGLTSRMGTGGGNVPLILQEDKS